LYVKHAQKKVQKFSSVPHVCDLPYYLDFCYTLMRIKLPHLLPFVVIFVNKSMTFHRQKFLLVSPSSIEFKYE
jgi:hypothetical protein